MPVCSAVDQLTSPCLVYPCQQLTVLTSQRKEGRTGQVERFMWTLDCTKSFASFISFPVSLSRRLPSTNSNSPTSNRKRWKEKKRKNTRTCASTSDRQKRRKTKFFPFPSRLSFHLYRVPRQSAKETWTEKQTHRDAKLNSSLHSLRSFPFLLPGRRHQRVCLHLFGSPKERRATKMSR